MTLGRFYNVKVLGRNKKVSPSDLYNTTHYFDGVNIFPFLNHVFSLPEDEFQSFLEKLGFESLNDRPFELVSLLVYINYKKPDDNNTSKKLSIDEVKENISSVEFGDNIHSNIINLLSKFGYENKTGVLQNPEIVTYFKNNSPQNFYFCCYNILKYTSLYESYNYEVQDIFYFTNMYITSFKNTFNITRFSITKLCRDFGVGDKIKNLNKFSTLYEYLNLINTEDDKREVAVKDIFKYSDNILIKKFDFEGEYTTRLELIHNILYGQ